MKLLVPVTSSESLLFVVRAENGGGWVDGGGVSWGVNGGGGVGTWGVNLCRAASALIFLRRFLAP